MDSEEEIVDLIEGIRSITYRSLKNVLAMAKEAALEGNSKECIDLGKCAMHQVELSNNVIQTLLRERNRIEWAILEDAENYIHEQKVEAIFCDLISTSIAISSMKGRVIEA